MKIGNKILLILFFTFLTLIILFFIGIDTLLQSSYLEIEQKAIFSNMQRLKNILQANLDNLNKIGKDWSEWDDTYKFVQDGNSSFVKSNLLAKTFVDLHINLMVFYNSRGEIVFGKYYDLESLKEISLSDKFTRGEFFNYLDSNINRLSKNMTGLINDSKYGTMLITALPVLTTLGTGPGKGILIMGYRFDSLEISRISKMLGSPIKISLFDSSVHSNTFTTSDVNINILETGFIRATAIINDLLNRPAIILESLFPRTFYSQAKKSLLLFALYFLFVILVSSIVTIIFINKFIIKRIKYFRNYIKNIRNNEELIERITISGNDEIKDLSDEFNNMIENISKNNVQQQEIKAQLKSSYDQLKELSKKMESVREDERSKIALELHDDLGQLLTRLKLDVSYLENITSSNLDDKVRSLFLEQTSSINTLINNVMSIVIRITSELRPAVLDSFGLSSAIIWQIQQYKKTTKIIFNYLIEPENITTDNEKTTVIFRVFQEALTNTIRHSKATEVDIYLEKTDKYISLDMRDNGIGINNLDMNKSRSLGIIGMRERVKFLDGEFDLNSDPAKGTTINVKIPITI